MENLITPIKEPGKMNTFDIILCCFPVRRHLADRPST
jgi:hypothetical protein